ncbi:GC-rich sequence DNA-binding factor-like protein-domain-containing protein [Halteromyces radiatus]|uniref:GC-rich sequence DNA-binding factor-like protein-domain-containing protein n=1 Tax=Halteromyces radiatus TaxID=101107 RepID=UPI00222069EB|nr:GC-rich sequence DNA-binding factor-like protein-domain-containing protein [Halteromyces radiatus]KAI8089274.1 GC-rich sequence DNA-binding factor-like protein-domain-containing protein [Halteromyces radiatus]
MSDRRGLGGSSIATTATSFLPAKKKDPSKDRVKTQDKGKPSSPRQRGSASPSPGPGFAAFTKHTTGFGQKMLEKMGWTAGKGLGAGGEGMVNPVETKQRPKGMGMGFRGFQERTEQTKLEAMETSEEEEEEEEQDEIAAPRQAWKRKDKIPQEQTIPSVKSRKAKKVTYQTANDILADVQQSMQQQPQKVIDMTGPSIREISISDIRRTDSPTLMETTTRLPELRHNLRLIVDLSRGDLENLSREKQNTAFRLKAMEEELDVIQQRHKVDEERLDKIQQVKAIGLQLQQISRDALANGMYESANMTTLFGEPFEQLKTKYMDQVVHMRLDAMVVAVWAPIMKYRCVHWNVLENPLLGLDDIKRWRPLLLCNDDMEKKKSSRRRHTKQNDISLEATPFETMMNTIWLNKVRSAINNSWQVREPDAVIQLLEAWQPVLPRFIFENIIYQLVLPKLTRAVADWDPRNDEQLVHTWIHPWLPVLQAWRLADICTTIRHKLSVILRQWHPSDESALEVVGRWNDVWTRQQMDHFLQKNVLPKLIQVLRREFVVNPRDQQLEPLAWCLAWNGILSDQVFGELLDNEIFPQWLRVLYKWLTMDPNHVNYDEIKEWYMWWKQVFTSLGIADHPVLLKWTRRALEMMNAASSGESIEAP